jgi:hypothetical protein
MPKAGFEAAITASERLMTAHTSDRSATATGEIFFTQPNSFLVIILQLPTQFNSKLISLQAGVPKLDPHFPLCF